MTDKQQPEALELASVAESADLAGYPTAKKANAYCLCLLEDCAQMIRRLHAENGSLLTERERNLDSIRVNNEIINKKNAELETLRAKLKTHEAQLYTAPQPSPVAQGDALDAERLDWLTFNLSGKALRDIGVVWSEHGDARRAIDAARTAQEGASHEQAPAQAASSAVLKAIREANMQLVRTGDDAFMLVTLKRAAPQQEVQEPVAWRELCRRLYVGLFYCNQQMTSGERPKWQQGKAVRDVLADAKAALDAAPQPTQPQAWAVPLTEEQITAAAKKLAECMDYPWDYMNYPGQAEMRKHARAVVEAAHGIKGGQHGAE